MNTPAVGRTDCAGHRSDRTVRILQLTDFHFPPVAGRSVQGIDTEQTFSAVAKSALSGGRRYDLALLTGDLADDPSESAYLRLRERLLAVDPAIPCYCLPGNHDDSTLMRDYLVGGKIRMDSRIVLSHWQIVCLDSCVVAEPGGYLRECQFELLQRAIAGEPEKHLLVAVHHHPVPSGSAWLDTMIIRNAEALVSVVQTVRPRACAVVFGHIHQALDRTIGAIRFLASPATCRQFKPNCRDFCFDRLPPGYRWIELSDDGGIMTGVEYLV